MLGLEAAAARPPLFQRAAIISDLLVQKQAGTLPRMATSSSCSAGVHQGLSWCACAAGAATAAAPLGCCKCVCAVCCGAEAAAPLGCWCCCCAGAEGAAAPLGCCWCCCAGAAVAAAPLGCCWCCCAGAAAAAAPLECCWCCCGCCCLCCAASLRASAYGPQVGSSSLMLGSGNVFRRALKTFVRRAHRVASLAAA